MCFLEANPSLNDIVSKTTNLHSWDQPRKRKPFNIRDSASSNDAVMFARKDIERDILSNYRQYGRDMRYHHSEPESNASWPRVFVDHGKQPEVEQRMTLKVG